MRGVSDGQLYFSKIKCRFIAVFDNDAVGFQSLCTLFREIKVWPDNFRIILYPEIKLFDHYPTISPNGRIVNDDINRKACSIELYLPDSIIKPEGKYYPIEWEVRKNVMLTKGEEMSLYQGVISNKDKILKKYEEFQKSIEIGENLFVEEDWQKCLLTKIVYAFTKG